MICLHDTKIKLKALAKHAEASEILRFFGYLETYHHFDGPGFLTAWKGSLLAAGMAEKYFLL